MKNTLALGVGTLLICASSFGCSGGVSEANASPAPNPNESSNMNSDLPHFDEIMQERASALEPLTDEEFAALKICIESKLADHKLVGVVNGDVRIEPVDDERFDEIVDVTIDCADQAGISHKLFPTVKAGEFRLSDAEIRERNSQVDTTIDCLREFGYEVERVGPDDMGLNDFSLIRLPDGRSIDDVDPELDVSVVHEVERQIDSCIPNATDHANGD